MRLYRVSAGSWVQVDEACVLGAGGEGRVYGVTGAPELAAKIFDDGGRPGREDKLRAMIENAPAQQAGGHTSIAWPEDLLCEGPGRSAVGFLMPRARNGRVIDDYYNPQARLEHCPLFHYEYLIVVARNLSTAVHSLHQRGYVIGDVKQSNILVTPNALVTLVDTDSFQVRDEAQGTIYRCPVGTPEYTPPELQGLAAPGLLRPEHDLFGLGTLVFQLLMEGVHPFAGAYTGEDDPPPLGERIRMGWFPYDRSALATLSGVTFKRQMDLLAPPFVPARKALPLSVLPGELQSLFVRCFAFGHHDPSLRPSADEWRQALDRARTSLVKCAANVQHRYSAHLAACPWCERMRTVLRGHDPYPAYAPAVVGYDAPPAPTFPATPTVVTPLTPPLPSTVLPAAKPKSGWAAYAIAALGLPIFLGLMTSRELSDPSASPRVYHSEPWSGEPGSTYSTGAPVAPSFPTDPTPMPGREPSPSQASLAAGTLTPDGRFAALVTSQREADLMDCRTGRVLGSPRMADQDSAISAIAVARSGNLMALTNGQGVRLWELHKAGTPILLPDHSGISAMAFTPDSKHLAVADNHDGPSVKLVDIQTGETALTFAVSEPVSTLGFSADGKWLFGMAPGGYEKHSTLKCWNAETSGLVWERSGKAWISRFAIAPDGGTLAIGARGGIDQRYTANGERTWSIAADGNYPNADPLCYSPDSRMLAMTNHNSVRVVRADVSAGSYVDVHAWHVIAAAFSADGKRLITLNDTNMIEEWDVDTGGKVLRHNIGY